MKPKTPKINAEDHYLLLRGVLSGKVRYERWDNFKGEVCCGGLRFVTQNDKEGIPELTTNARAAIRNALASDTTT